MFVRKSILTATYLFLGSCLFIFPVTAKLLRKSLGEILASSMTLFLLVFYIYLIYFFFNYPNAKIIMAQKNINREIIYAGRFLVIELESGVTVYDAFSHLIENYQNIGKYVRHIITKVDLGTDMESAINDESESIPSQDMKKVLWQILNSIKTGADISTALNTVIDQIVKEQDIEVKEYGRKLNPMAMFYMIIAVILPSLGMTMFMVVATFIGIKLDIAALLTLAVVMGFVQFLFLATIKSSRPASGED